ncbi:hypothetical protein QTJ16_002235 [Diplocarpon rosae]|uniref:DUF7872 domain-containing protein n=1 Tax=Diplocarpon rosae TaxID=946125 RepID=A0AAD9WEW5_9HELO|nr:hypothetical protein QTJ16_002235 [Diplocarpon rosae]PBP17757.1 hypothetical protein BUE80_DR011412 [Diplocarpon rosae]
MRVQSVLLAAASIPIALATPVPAGTGTGADSCESEPLTADTWKKLEMDRWLEQWGANNLTAAATNNVQALADSFDAPNFFCGLDNFCNAGQPCVPVDLPAWYALVAIQNWNSYMNSVNTVITFGSNILSLILPEIVKDFYQPPDYSTPLQAAWTIFSTIAGAVPTVGSKVRAQNDKIVKLITPPQKGENLFLQWSNIASSLGEVVKQWQAAISESFEATLNAEVNSEKGINSVLLGGDFLGVAHNFTQDDIQAAVIDSLKLYIVSLILQSDKVYVYRGPLLDVPCRASRIDEFCHEGRQYLLVKGGDGQNEIAETLINKYGMTPERLFVSTVSCFEKNGRKQLATGYNGFIPLDSNDECLFHLQVCLDDKAGGGGIDDDCRALGLDI